MIILSHFNPGSETLPEYLYIHIDGCLQWTYQTNPFISASLNIYFNGTKAYSQNVHLPQAVCLGSLNRHLNIFGFNNSIGMSCTEGCFCELREAEGAAEKFAKPHLQPLHCPFTGISDMNLINSCLNVKKYIGIFIGLVKVFLLFSSHSGLISHI